MKKKEDNSSIRSLKNDLLDENLSETDFITYLQKIIDKHEITENELQYFLNQACLMGLIQVAKYISSLINVRYDEDLPMRLCIPNSVDLIEYFIHEKDCNPHIQQEYLLRNSIAYDQKELYELLKKYSPNIHAKNEGALYYAIKKPNRTKYAKELIDLNANIHINNDYLFYLALEEQRYEIIQYMFDKGFKPNPNIIKQKYGKERATMDTIEDEMISICLINEDMKLFNLLKKNGLNISNISPNLLLQLRNI